MTASMHESLIIPNQQTAQALLGGPLAAASKMVPVPESLMSPDCPPSTIVHRMSSGTNNHHPHIGHQIPKAIKTKGLYCKITLLNVLQNNFYSIQMV
jgi:centrosomal protein CEP97